MDTERASTAGARPDAAQYTPSSDAPAPAAPAALPNKAADAGTPAAPVVTPPAPRGWLAAFVAYLRDQFRQENFAGRVGLAKLLFGLALAGAFTVPRAAYHAVRDFFTHDRVAFAQLVERLRKEDAEGQEYVIDTLATFAREHDELRAEARTELARFVRRRTRPPGVRPAGAVRDDACAGLPEAQGVGDHVLRALNTIGALGRDAPPGALGLAGIDLRGAQLHDSLVLRGADLTGACLADAQLRAADLTGARLDRASLDRAALEGAVLTHAGLRGARLRAAQLAGASADSAELSKADLTAAALDGARLRRVELRGTNLTCAVLTDATVDDADWTDARLPWAYLEGTRLRGRRTLDTWRRIADLRGAYLPPPNELPDDALAWASAGGAVVRPLTQLQWRDYRAQAAAADSTCGPP